ncbi:fungal-specific transcription factor domain-containing protein [Mycena floridula]|nr:fungal-specific transcription factor domain-containing protein [Mycena floridula]
MPGNVCSNCVAFGSICTHTYVKKGKPTTSQENSPPLAIPETISIRVFNEHHIIRCNVAQILSESVPYVAPKDPATVRSTIVDLAHYIQVLEGELVAALEASRAVKDGSTSSPSAVPDITESLEQEVPREPLRFPDPDLLHSLVDLYFLNVNIFFPIFHRPTFDRLLTSNFHHTDIDFGHTVLAICALASHYSSDPRVFMPGTGSEQSSGWIFFRQIRPLRSTYNDLSSIYELQLLCVYILYLLGTSKSRTSWVLLGVAVRRCQERGLHRRGSVKNNTLEGELLKRVTWVILIFDIFMGAFRGGPRAINSEDFDQDLPVACDDEYWEHPDPEKAFKQPPRKPSKMAAWIILLDLTVNILAVAQQNLYSPSRKDLLDSDNQRQTVMRIDSALNRWIDSIPEFLRWDPQKEDLTFFNQSSVLYVTYYYVQILIHKSFIPSQANVISTDRSFPSLAICANAARSCAHVMDIQSRRGFLPLPNIKIAVFNSALVLIMNHWRLAQSNHEDEYADVYKCINILRLYEARWQVAGRLCDLLEYLIHAGKKNNIGKDLSSLKRPRDNNEDAPPIELTPRKYARMEDSVMPDSYSLPFYTEDLSSLPLHGFDFSDSEQWLQSAPLAGPSYPGISVDLDPTIEDILRGLDPLNVQREGQLGDAMAGWGLGEFMSAWDQPQAAS